MNQLEQNKFNQALDFDTSSLSEMSSEFKLTNLKRFYLSIRPAMQDLVNSLVMKLVLNKIRLAIQKLMLILDQVFS